MEKNRLSEIIVIMGKLAGIYNSCLTVMVSDEEIKALLSVSSELTAVFMEIKREAGKESTPLGLELQDTIQAQDILDVIHNVLHSIRFIYTCPEKEAREYWCRRLGEYLAKFYMYISILFQP